MIRRLRRFHEGVLDVGGRFDRTMFILDPASSRPVFPAPPGALEGDVLTLHAPEDEPGAVRLAGAPVELDPLRHEACDRWLFYFGRPRWSRFCAIGIDHIKSVDEVISGDEVPGNPLRQAEAGLLRELNLRPELLASACERLAKVRPTAPRAVGLDPYGLDIRAGFGPVRLEFEGVHGTEGEVRSALASLLGGA